MFEFVLHRIHNRNYKRKKIIKKKKKRLLKRKEKKNKTVLISGIKHIQKADGIKTEPKHESLKPNIQAPAPSCTTHSQPNH